MVHYLRAANVQDGALDLTDVKQMNFTPAEQQIFSLRAGDVLVTEGSGSLRSVGASAVWRGESDGAVCFQNTLLRMRPRSGITDGRFLEWWARSAFGSGLFASIATGANIYHISAERARAVPIDLPPIDEQRRIANFLDAETAQLRLIENRSHRLTGLLEERKFSLTAECFTFERPEDALLIPLRRAVRQWIDYRGATPTKTASGTPLVTAKNIRNGLIDLKISREYIATDSYTDWMRRGLLEGKDVLLTTEAPLGQVAMVNDTSIALAQRIIVLRANQDVCSPEWLYWYLRSPQGQSELERRATGSTALGIKADRLRGVPIPLPHPNEAAGRLNRLSACVTRVELLERQLIKQKALLAERRQALITAAVTGQFDVTTASGRNVTEGVTA
ncbi:restriction endonuclease subunit S [Streptomyces sp. NRRL F-5126]|uniref:restriction endonuclease subunit S n=1 Tax=Streptomyces sp. NRRL F-5126 TaxID=1463857 RepID=UPI000A7103B9|nr:restriction endonuclease subunit S [Streptomyces sp. NRRL F-5126]